MQLQRRRQSGTPPYDPRMIGRHDRQESESEEQQAIRVLQIARLQFSSMAESLPSPRAGSMLMVEREHTAREPIDAMFVAQRVRSVENLERLFAMMIDDEGGRVLAYPFSGYSLIRAAIESSAVALWLIQPGRKQGRVMRALQRSYRHATDALKLAETIASDDVVREVREQTQRVIERLEELKNSLNALRQVELGPPPSHTDILKAVSDRPPGPNGKYALSSPLVVWKVSSAFIHGSDGVTRALSDIRQVAEFDGGVGTFEVTPSLRMLASSAAVCVELLRRADARYVELASHDYAGREVPA